jgi:hypothetical protein
MEDFKQIIKMKSGGSVDKAIEAYEKRERKTNVSGDMAQDKTIVKKGVKQHEENLHKGQPKTELKLKMGGRAKKEGGTVKKYKAGGTVENAYGTPKTKKDIKDIANTKRQKPKKMQMGGMTGQGAVSDMERAAMAGGMAGAPSAAIGQGQMTELEKRRMMEKLKRARALDPAQQADLIKQSPAAAGLVPPPAGRYKKGGCVTKMKDGGSLKDVDANENPGLSKLPTTVRNKMGYAKKGGKVC